MSRKACPVTATFQGEMTFLVLSGLGSLLTDSGLEAHRDDSCREQTGRPQERRLWTASAASCPALQKRRVGGSGPYLYEYADGSVMPVLDTNGDKQELLKLYPKWMYFYAQKSSSIPNITLFHNSL